MGDAFGLIIDGKVVQTSRVKQVCNPWSGEVVGECCWGGEAEVEMALASGTAAAKVMRDLRSYQRADILHSAANLLAERREEFARTISLESAKPIREARAEATRAESTFRLAAELTRQWGGDVLPLDVTPAAGDRIALVQHFPVGLVTGISPFNFPLNLVAHKVAPAIAAGCAINLKPASSTPMTALKLGELLLEAGLPTGGCNIIPVDSKQTAPLIDDTRVKALTFTGSGAVGWNLKLRANKIKVCLELGGNAAAIVEPSADLEHAVSRIVVGGYAFAGQICISVQHILVHSSIYHPFIERFLPKVESLVIGNPLGERTELSSMIDEGEAIRTVEWIEEAVREGATLLTGGVRDKSVVSPAVLTDVPEICRISSDEAFAPVTVVRAYDHFEEALDWVNSQQYGLQAGVFTSNLQQVMLAFNRLEVGGVIIGDIPTFRADNYPYGGVKNSGFGREGIRYAMEDMSELRALILPTPR